LAPVKQEVTESIVVDPWPKKEGKRKRENWVRGTGTKPEKLILKRAKEKKGYGKR